MRLARLRARSTTMPIGIRVLVGAPLLDELFEAIQKHADWGRRPPLAESFEEVVREYQARDAELYEVADRIRRGLAGGHAGAVHMLVCELLTAIELHREQAHLLRRFRRLSDLGELHEERDVVLYDVAASARVRALQNAEEIGICLGRASIDAILTRQKTVIRVPVEFTHTGKHLPGHYRAGGGENGSYPVLALAAGGSLLGTRVFPGLRLKVLDVWMERLGDITDDEAQLEGFPNRAALFMHVLERDGALAGDQKVWRYELEPVEAAQGS